VDFVLNNIWLVLIAATSGGMLLWPLVSQSAGGPAVSTLEATQLINRRDALVLDVRSGDDYARGHILHARSMPSAQLAGRFDELQKFKSRPIILACQNGTAAGGSCAELRKAGFTEVYRLTGGVSAWTQAGLPVAK
jgi:rhodanese-related sulfurtransferase